MNVKVTAICLLYAKANSYYYHIKQCWILVQNFVLNLRYVGKQRFVSVVVTVCHFQSVSQTQSVCQLSVASQKINIVCRVEFLLKFTMFSINQWELRQVTISSLISCIYLPSIVTAISYKGLLYTSGNGSSLYILVLIFIAELLKTFYLTSSTQDAQPKRNKPKNRASDLIKSFLFLLCVMFSFFIGIILFGAPVLDNHEQTLMLSTLLTLLTVFPLIAHSGVETSMQLLFGVKSYSKDSVIEMLVNNALLTVCGAWLGAVVIPLDWNTPWQQWPIPCYLGAIGGYLLSNVLTVLKVTLIAASSKHPALNVIVNIVNKLQMPKNY